MRVKIISWVLKTFLRVPSILAMQSIFLSQNIIITPHCKKHLHELILALNLIKLWMYNCWVLLLFSIFKLKQLINLLVVFFYWIFLLFTFWYFSWTFSLLFLFYTFPHKKIVISFLLCLNISLLFFSASSFSI